MTVSVDLWVWLKGVDLVAGTAYLTLVEKMGYEDRLLGLCRTDKYSFAFGSDQPADAVGRLKRFLSVQSTFYNRNKHNYFLDCRWQGGSTQDGTHLEALQQRLSGQAVRAGGVTEPKDFDSTKAPKRVILSDVPVFRSVILIEDLDPSAKTALEGKLETELSTGRVTVSALGTCWYLALHAPSEDEVRAITKEIAVTGSRDRGLLLNPNYQGFQLLSIEAMGTGEI